MLIFTYFAQWFIYTCTFIHDDASMARCDQGWWQKSTFILIWAVFEHEKIHTNFPFTRSRNPKDVEIVRVQILVFQAISRIFKTTKTVFILNKTTTTWSDTKSWYKGQSITCNAMCHVSEFWREHLVSLENVDNLVEDAFIAMCKHAKALA